MSKKRYSPEQVIGKLREAEVSIAKGQLISQTAKTLGITDQTYYRWRKEYGGMRTDQARRLEQFTIACSTLRGPYGPRPDERQSHHSSAVRTDRAMPCYS